MGVTYYLDEVKLKHVAGSVSFTIDNSKLYMDWEKRKDGCVEVAENTDSEFYDEERFIDDLKTLRVLGVRGFVVVKDEFGDYSKYILDDNAVNEYCGHISYDKEPDISY